MTEKSKVLLTGGAGFLGSHVTRLFLESGHSVVILDDFSNGKMAHLEDFKGHPGLEIIEGDITVRGDVDKAIDGCTMVIHLAVLCLRESIKSPRRVVEVISEGTLNCLDAALNNKVELFLNCSSSEAYGSAAYVPMDEKHPLDPETPYAAAKVAQDMYVRTYGQTYGLPWVTIRPFNMYGPNSHWQGHRGELIPKMIVRAMNKQPLIVFGDGEQKRDFLYVEEAAHALVTVAESPKAWGQCVNFCTGVETSVREIAELICQEFDIDPATAIESQPERPGDVHRHFGDARRFKELLGFAPSISIEEGIKKTADWFRALPHSPEELLSQEVLRNWE
jgi:UDP-glucose 4-epimerase